MNLSKKLNTAINAKNLDRVKQLLREGASADSSSLFLAIERKSYPMLEALVASGADLEILEPYWNRTPLVKAIKFQDAVALKVLLDAGASPNRDCVGGPPLIAAAAKGWAEGAKMLIEKGTNLEQQNCSENTPLMIAARRGHLPIVSLLIEAGANPLAEDLLGRTAYEIAVEEKEDAVAQLLGPISTRQKPRIKDNLELLLEAIKNRDEPSFEKYLAAGVDLNGEDKLGWQTLDRAIDVGSLHLVRRLIEAGADVNRADREGSSPLDMAIAKRDNGIIKLLLQAGARPRSEDPLYTACLVGNLEMAKIFLEAGYDPTDASRTGGETTLHLSAHARSIDLVKLLLSKRVPVDAQNRDGWTALFYAVTAGSLSFSERTYPSGSTALCAEKASNTGSSEPNLIIAKLLLDHGADPNLKNKAGRTALTYATSPAMAELLIRAGARLDIRDKQGHDARHWLKKNVLTLGDLPRQALHTASSPRKRPRARRSDKRRGGP